MVRRPYALHDDIELVLNITELCRHQLMQKVLVYLLCRAGLLAPRGGGLVSLTGRSVGGEGGSAGLRMS